MKCECVDSLGEKLPYCTGICVDTEKYINKDYVARSLVTIEERIEKINGSIVAQVESLTKIFDFEVAKQYKLGFREGFEMARDMYE